MLKISQKITFLTLLVSMFIIPIVFPDLFMKEDPYFFKLITSMFLIIAGCLSELLISGLIICILEFLFGETVVSEFLWTLTHRFLGDDYIS